LFRGINYNAVNAVIESALLYARTLRNRTVVLVQRYQLQCSQCCYWKCTFFWSWANEYWI